jgi:hypothetical protein
MSMNDPPDQSLTPIRTAIGDFIRYFMREMLPAVPWRAAALWGIALGGTFVIREVLDLLKPTTDYGLRSLASTWAGLAICFCAGFQGAWRDRGERHLHVWHGIRVTLTAIVIGFLAAIVGNTSAVFVVSTFHQLDLPHELAWALEIPLPVMLVLGGLVGMAGAAIAAGLARFRHIAVMQS